MALVHFEPPYRQQSIYTPNMGSKKAGRNAQRKPSGFKISYNLFIL